MRVVVHQWLDLRCSGVCLICLCGELGKYARSCCVCLGFGVLILEVVGFECGEYRSSVCCHIVVSVLWCMFCVPSGLALSCIGRSNGLR